MFDRELFFKLCKDYGVPFSSNYKVPMLNENGELKELTSSDIKRILVPALATFAYMETPYLFKECAPEKIEILADDLLAA